MRKSLSGLLLSLALALSACGEESEQAAAPPPKEPPSEAVGHYCGMIVVEHDGPKGQIFLGDRAEPIWFTSVRDTIAFTMLPEESDDIAAIYVNDMGRSAAWDQPDAGAWVEARQAVFVLGSGKRGGMGAPEAVPFSERNAAEVFVEQNGGQIVGFDEIPEDAILGPADGPPAGEGGMGMSHGDMEVEQADEGHQKHE